MKGLCLMIVMMLQASLFDAKAETPLRIENANDSIAHVDTAGNGELIKWMEGFLTYPDFLHGTKQYVKAGIWIKLKTDGALLVTNIKADDLRLKQYIKESLNGQYFKATDREQDFHFTLSFKEVN